MNAEDWRRRDILIEEEVLVGRLLFARGAVESLSAIDATRARLERVARIYADSVLWSAIAYLDGLRAAQPHRPELREDGPAGYDRRGYDWELVWGADQGFTWIGTDGRTFRLEYIVGKPGKQERVQVTGQLEDVLQAIPDRGEFEEAARALVHRPNRRARGAS